MPEFCRSLFLQGQSSCSDVLYVGEATHSMLLASNIRPSGCIALFRILLGRTVGPPFARIVSAMLLWQHSQETARDVLVSSTSLETLFFAGIRSQKSTNMQY